MSKTFEADKIDREKPDPVEGSSTRWLTVPPLLLAFFLGFGVTYLTLQTDSLQFREGDMRSAVSATSDSPAPHSASEEPSPISGETIYQRNCQACHQPTGAGLGDAFPPLDGSEWVNGHPARLSGIILYGISGEIEVKGRSFRGTMPTFGGKLSEEEIAAVASYVRSAWSNTSQPVESSTVKRVRESLKRDKPWGGQTELEAQDWRGM